jgi:hypothetical protein
MQAQPGPRSREVSGSGEDPRQLPGSTEGAELTMDTRNFMILCLLSKFVILKISAMTLYVSIEIILH